MKNDLDFDRGAKSITLVLAFSCTINDIMRSLWLTIFELLGGIHAPCNSYLKQHPHFDLQVTVVFRGDIPRQIFSPPISVECLVPNVNPEAPVISSSDISIVDYDVKAVGTSTGSRRFDVIVEYSFDFEQPLTTALVTSFELWLDRFQAPEDTTNLPRRIPRIPVLNRNGTFQETIEIEISEDMFDIFFQVAIINQI